MAALEDLKPGLQVTGVLPNQPVTIVDVRWHGSVAVELFYKRGDGTPGAQLLYRHDEADLALAEAVTGWTFAADGGTLSPGG